MTPLRPRSMLFTLFGDYAYPSEREVWLGSLVLLGRELGIAAGATRSAVARLARAGWIRARKSKNRSHYGLTEAGRRLIEEGTQRIYHSGEQDWDGTWCLLLYSIPETKRMLRDRVRKRLAWLGFGALGGGAYASARDMGGPASALVEGFGVGAFASIFTAKLRGPERDADLVRRCWDLPVIAHHYERFIDHYAPRYRRDAARLTAGTLSDEDAFAARFALTHDFRRFPFVDPDLPDSLLPENWAGTRARRLFEDYHRKLARGALRHFNAVLRVERIPPSSAH
ncbi:MAG: phenylacetic acid degradation operon negative regulatory protein PaaX [Candidatus Eremiobacteraeota bacterium]|nr:phenylacetic acid degradation operon negative regulatory protein PaaX [Candidatus Eremiobacteraeota bacterium]MBC5826869.1 phenylacetic acid degradation operon negative regulatory protein PaaX [Candidatus Eremiobacteraeota bacterium]